MFGDGFEPCPGLLDDRLVHRVGHARDLDVLRGDPGPDEPRSRLTAALDRDDVGYHLVHHLFPRVPFYRYGTCFHALRPDLEARGADIVDLGS